MYGTAKYGTIRYGGYKTWPLTMVFKRPYRILKSVYQNSYILLSLKRSFTLRRVHTPTMKRSRTVFKSAIQIPAILPVQKIKTKAVLRNIYLSNITIRQNKRSFILRLQKPANELLQGPKSIISMRKDIKDVTISLLK